MPSNKYKIFSKRRRGFPPVPWWASSARAASGCPIHTGPVYSIQRRPRGHHVLIPARSDPERLREEVRNRARKSELVYPKVMNRELENLEMLDLEPKSGKILKSQDLS